MRLQGTQRFPRSLLSRVRPFNRFATGLPTALIVAIAIALVTIWFSPRLIIAYAEAGIITYNNVKMLEVVSHVWVSSISTGYPNPAFISGVGTQALLAGLETIGFSPYQKQAIIFFIFLATSGVSTYHLAKTIWEKWPRRDLAAMLAALFYMLNPYAIIYVWNRFLITMNVAYAVLPLALLLFALGLSKRKLSFALWMNIALLIFSSWIYVIPIVLLLVLLSYLLYHMLRYRDTSSLYFALRFTGLSGGLWLVLNLWILAPTFLDIGAAWWGFNAPQYATQYLSGIKLVDAFRLSFYFDSNAVIWPFYESLGGLLIAFAVPATVFSLLLKQNTPNQDSKIVLYLVSLSMLGLGLASLPTTFLAEPVSEFLLRLPYSSLLANNLLGEKALVLTALGYSLLFGVSITRIHTLKIRFRVRWPRRTTDALTLVTAASLVILVLGINAWPMWTGDVFSHPGIPGKFGYTQVPTYYEEAEKWFREQGGSYRLLALPFVSGGTAYSWPPYGYIGGTTDWVIFSHPVIMESSGSPTPLTDNLVRAVRYWMQIGRMDLASKALSLLAVRYVVVHGDFYEGNLTKETLQQLNHPLTPWVKVENLVDADRDILASPNWVQLWSAPPSRISFDNTSNVLRYEGYSSEVGNFAMQYLFSQPVNVSIARYLDLTVMSEVSGRLWISIVDSQGRERIFDGRAEWMYSIPASLVGTWVNFTLPLEQNSSLNMTSISRVTVGLVNLPPNSQAALSIGRIAEDLGSSESPSQVVPRKKFGQLYVYEVVDSLDRIYAATNIWRVDDYLDMLAKLADNEFIVGEGVLALAGAITETSFVLEGSYNTTRSPLNIRIQEGGPSKFIASVSNATSPYVLVFSESFDRRWIARVDGSTVPETYHFMGNGYANAWLITRLGSYEIQLEFLGEQTVIWTGWISFIGLFSSITYALVLLPRWKRRKDIKLATD